MKNNFCCLLCFLCLLSLNSCKHNQTSEIPEIISNLPEITKEIEEKENTTKQEEITKDKNIIEEIIKPSEILLDTQETKNSQDIIGIEDIQDTLDTQENSDVRDDTDIFGTQDAQDTSEDSNNPNTSDTPYTQETPDSPDASNTPYVPEISTSPEIQKEKFKYSSSSHIYLSKEGSDDYKSIEQKQISLTETENGYNVLLTPSKSFIDMYDELTKIPDYDEENLSDENLDLDLYLNAIFALAKFNEKYKFNFETKNDAITYMKSFNEYRLPDYVFKGKEETNDYIIYKYYAKTFPEILYSAKSYGKIESYSSFDKLKEKFPYELRNISCFDILGSNCSDMNFFKFFEFQYKGDDETYTFYKLKEKYKEELNGLLFKDNSFMYQKEEENIKYSSLDLLKLAHPDYKTEDDNNAVIKEELKGRELYLKFFGKGVNLSYSDFGYWQEIDLFDGYETKGYAIPLIGGAESYKISKEEIKDNLTFKGTAIANIKPLNKSNTTITGDITYIYSPTVSENKHKFNINFNNWYNIDVVSKENTTEGLSEWTFKENTNFNMDLPKIYESAFYNNAKLKEIYKGIDYNAGFIKNIEYYKDKDKEKVESVGVLEYLDVNSASLSIIYGAKNN